MQEWKWKCGSVRLKELINIFILKLQNIFVWNYKSIAFLFTQLFVSGSGYMDKALTFPNFSFEDPPLPTFHLQLITTKCKRHLSRFIEVKAFEEAYSTHALNGWTKILLFCLRTKWFWTTTHSSFRNLH